MCVCVCVRVCVKYDQQIHYKRCGLQRVVKCWKTSRLLDAYFWKFWQFWTTSKIVLKMELCYYLNCAYSRRSTVCRVSYTGPMQIKISLKVLFFSTSQRGRMSWSTKSLCLCTAKLYYIEETKKWDIEIDKGRCTSQERAIRH